MGLITIQYISILLKWDLNRLIILKNNLNDPKYIITRSKVHNGAEKKV